MFIGKFFKGGTQVPHNKNTTECETKKIKLPDKVIIPMLQHIGASCIPTVKKGEHVKVGQVIGDSDKFISAPIHSSVSGKVKAVDSMLYPGGVKVQSVEIETDGEQEIHEDIKPPVYNDNKELLNTLKRSGLVGLGGAGFPTHVKLAPPPGTKVDTLIINAAECEPYITADYREIMENMDGIMDGIEVAAGILEVKNVVIGVEDNKPDAVKLLKRTVKEKSNIKIVSLKTRYPQGAEKMLIYAITGRKVPPGKLPADVGVVVMNVNSVSFISEYLKTGIPLVKKRVTVDGPAVKNPANVEVPIGTRLADVFEFCGGFKSEPSKVIMGGPMMGIAQFSLETSVVKHTNALIAFDSESARLPQESDCIRCGRCVKACPMNLMPLNINKASIRGDLEEMNKYHAMDCIECGSCAYVCPAKIHLVQSAKYAKQQIKNASSKSKAG